MSAPHAAGWSRRQFLGGVTLAGTAGLLSLRPVHVAAEPPPETTRLRVHHSYSLCLAPQYVAEALLRGEGFTEVHYVTHEEAGGLYPALASGAAGIANDFAPVLIMRIDAGNPITILGGLHVGCADMMRRLHEELGVPFEAFMQIERAEPAKRRGRPPSAAWSEAAMRKSTYPDVLEIWGVTWTKRGDVWEGPPTSDPTSYLREAVRCERIEVRGDHYVMTNLWLTLDRFTRTDEDELTIIWPAAEEEA